MVSAKLFIISISNPILAGVYDSNNNLIEIFMQEGKTSDILPLLYKDITKRYDIKKIYYVNGPGSYMSIKVSYMFLKTISISNDIPFKAASGFMFNNNSPIKALGKKYFFNTKDDKIIIDFLTNEINIEELKLPHLLNEEIFCNDTLPNYCLPAV